MKKLAKKAVAIVLGWQVRRLYRRNIFKVVAVAGSVGKTSTKLAIANVLKAKFKVRYQRGNYNDLLAVPLIYFGHDFGERVGGSLPMNPLTWLGIFIKNERVLLRPYPYGIVVIELGPDGPGQMAPFKKYVKADIGVLTAISPEHMEFFGDIETVAKEEMILADLSAKLLFNKDLVAAEYIKRSEVPVEAYDTSQVKDYRLDLPSKPQVYSASAAIAVGQELGMSKPEIKEGLSTIKPFAGRMRQLKGIKDSTIIDDSYNASPQAMKAALDTLYEFEAPQKIAVLGNMNELGDYSKQAHEEIGNYCDPKKVDLVVTIGPDANKYLAPAAKAKGCRVESYDNPYSAGESVKSQIKNGAVVLVKGSQNGVFAEEAVKLILANPSDAKKLVRQTPQWLKKKKF